MQEHKSDRVWNVAVCNAGESKAGWLDVAAIVGLLVAAFVARRNVLPADGLFGDDAWQAFGAAHGSLSNFITVGFSAPGFTGVLMLLHRIVGAPERMADVAFAAGVTTPALLYAALRHFGFARSISVLLGACLASEKFNIVYSGRVKPYVIEALVLLGFAVVVPRLVRVRFGWRATALWIAGSFAVGFFSPFALLVAAVAGLVLWLRPACDRSMRTIAVAGQGVLYVVLALVVRMTYSSALLQRWWKTTYDGFVNFDAQPLGLASHVFTHMRRAAAVFSGGPAWWAALVMVVALVALAIDGVVRNRSAHTVRAQYLLLVVLVAVAGSIAGALPFGPTADGMRLSLWLVPVFAIGTASALQRLHNVLTHRWPARMALDAALVIVAALLALSASNGGPNYPLNGSRSAVEFVEQSLKPDDAVLIEAVGSLYPYAAASRLNLIVRPQRKKVAFIPEIRDRRFHTIAFTGTYGNTLLLTTRSDTGGKFEVARAVNGADRVFVFVVALRDLPPAGRRALANVLSRAGFQMQVDARFHDAHVIVWQR